jgi:hypothetical protein
MQQLVLEDPARFFFQLVRRWLVDSPPLIAWKSGVDGFCGCSFASYAIFIAAVVTVTILTSAAIVSAEVPVALLAIVSEIGSL